MFYRCFSFGTINRWESGKYTPTIKLKRKLASYFEKYNIETDEDVDSLIDCIEENREPEIISE